MVWSVNLPPEHSTSPFSVSGQGVRVAVRLTPKAAQDRIDGVASDAAGAFFLKVAVTAVPEDGKANAALIKLLSKEWKVAKTTVMIVSGHTDRRKTLLLDGDPATLSPRLEQWISRYQKS